MIVARASNVRTLTYARFSRACHHPRCYLVRPFVSKSREEESAARFKMFQEQMTQLQDEQSNNAFGSPADEAEAAESDYHGMYKEQLQELKEEREALFGFTDQDQQAWSNADGHSHDQSFLDIIDQARQQEYARNNHDNQQRANPSRQHATNDHSHQSGNSATGLSHVSLDGSSVQMVDVGDKAVTRRIAVAQSRVVFPPEVIEAFSVHGSEELVGPKGPIFATAKLAGIMAAKKTSDLIPLCHPLLLDKVDITIELIGGNVALIRCECRVTHNTGVEMEALMGASVAALTIYDMTKAVSHRIRIEDTVLLSKSGGKRQVGDSDNSFLVE